MSAKSPDQDFSITYDIDIKSPSDTKSHWFKNLKEFLPDVFLGMMAALLSTTCYGVLAPVVHDTYGITLSWDVQYPLIGFIALSSGVVCFYITRRRTPSINAP